MSLLCAAPYSPEVTGQMLCSSSLSSVCRNGGTCVGNLLNGTMCQCPSAYTGIFCQDRQTPGETAGKCQCPPPTPPSQPSSSNVPPPPVYPVKTGTHLVRCRRGGCYVQVPLPIFTTPVSYPRAGARRTQSFLVVVFFFCFSFSIMNACYCAIAGVFAKSTELSKNEKV